MDLLAALIPIELIRVETLIIVYQIVTKKIMFWSYRCFPRDQPAADFVEQ